MRVQGRKLLLILEMNQSGLVTPSLQDMGVTEDACSPFRPYLPRFHRDSAVPGEISRLVGQISIPPYGALCSFCLPNNNNLKLRTVYLAR